MLFTPTKAVFFYKYNYFGYNYKKIKVKGLF